MRRSNLHFRKSKNRFYEALLWITGGACVVTSILVGSFVYTHMSLSKYQATMNELSTELDSMKNMTDEMVQKEEEYKNQLEGLSQEIAKYEPIVIPESMQN